MQGWSWEYVEETVTASRLEAINEMIAASLPAQGPKRQLTLDEFRAMHPNGISDVG